MIRTEKPDSGKANSRNMEQFTVDSWKCAAYVDAGAKCLAIQPVDEHDLLVLGSQVEYMAAEINVPFALAVFSIADWNRDLSPWEAPPVFGKDNFGSGASETLHALESRLLPDFIRRFGFPADIPVILGGYSLAAFFSLWSVYQADRFSAVAAASPSVWFPGWMEYAEAHSPQADCLYLSLGDREERTKNKLMATVGDCIRAQDRLLSGRKHILEWNEGNHFRDTDRRCARAFTWCIQQLCG